MKNNDRKRKYLVVDCDDVKRADYDIKRETSFNDFENVYYEKRRKTSTSIFEENGIPEEYRKIVIKINIPLSIYEAEEYITHVPFDITGHTRFKKSDSPIIRGRTVSLQLSEYVEFDTVMEYKTYEDIMNFYKELEDLGLLESYIDSIAQFFLRSPFKEETLDRIKLYILKSDC